MPQVAFVFPGQGSQYAGMGRDLRDRFDSAARVFEAADAALGIPLSDVMFAGKEDVSDDEALKQTEVTQPALFVHSMAVLEVLEEHGLLPDMAAGHSLGEYSALAAARAISVQQGLKVVRLRGELMGRAGRERPGSMAAVLGLGDDAVQAVCEEVNAGGEGVVQPANFNSPDQLVISGDEAAVLRASEILRERGARRVVSLPVSGAFHSPLMEHALEGLANALEKLEIEPPRWPVYLNVTGRPSTDPREIRESLLRQLTAPVLWTDTLRNMHADGAGTFYEIGAGNVLSGLVRRTLGKDVETQPIGNAGDVEAIVQRGSR